MKTMYVKSEKLSKIRQKQVKIQSLLLGVLIGRIITGKAQPSFSVGVLNAAFFTQRTREFTNFAFSLVGIRRGLVFTTFCALQLGRAIAT